MIVIIFVGSFIFQVSYLWCQRLCDLIPFVVVVVVVFSDFVEREKSVFFCCCLAWLDCIRRVEWNKKVLSKLKNKRKQFMFLLWLFVFLFCFCFVGVRISKKVSKFEKRLIREREIICSYLWFIFVCFISLEYYLKLFKKKTNETHRYGTKAHVNKSHS